MDNRTMHNHGVLVVCEKGDIHDKEINKSFKNKYDSCIGFFDNRVY